MPNWTTNHLYITGPKDQRDAFLKAIGNEKLPVDFMKIKPMPESLDLVDGSDTQLAIWAALRMEHNLPIAEIEFSNIVGRRYDTARLEEWLNEVKAAAFDHEDREVVFDGRTHPETPVEYVRWGRAYIDNYQKYGVLAWYDWCCQNWGTKWNACSGELQRDEENDFIFFDTAWSPPIGIVDVLPGILRDCGATDVNVEWKWAEEQGYFGGVFNISSEDIEDVYHEGDDAAYDLCEEVIGYSQRDYFEEENEEGEA